MGQLGLGVSGQQLAAGQALGQYGLGVGQLGAQQLGQQLAAGQALAGYEQARGQQALAQGQLGLQQFGALQGMGQQTFEQQLAAAQEARQRALGLGGLGMQAAQLGGQQALDLAQLQTQQQQIHPASLELLGCKTRPASSALLSMSRASFVSTILPSPLRW